MFNYNFCSPKDTMPQPELHIYMVDDELDDLVKYYHSLEELKKAVPAARRCAVEELTLRPLRCRSEKDKEEVMFINTKQRVIVAATSGPSYSHRKFPVGQAYFVIRSRST
jgi:hypothetical protein